MSRKTTPNAAHLSRVVAEVSRERLLKNLAQTSRIAQGHMKELRGVVAMVKANGYGHGLSEVARTFEKSNLTLALGVAAMEEGAELRAAGVRKPVWVFSGNGLCVPEASSYMKRFGLTPMIHTIEDLREIAEPRNQSFARAQGFHLKINTGMNRLGIAPQDFSRARSILKKSGLKPLGLCTHFSTAEDPSAANTRKQVLEFTQAVRDFSEFEVSYIHSANSAAILHGKELETSSLCNVIRPGLALYGYSGSDERVAGLRAALRLKARVLSSRQLGSGEVIGYGGTFRVRKTTSQTVLAIGYGDGIFRSLSNSVLTLGSMKAHRDVRILGRVSMDLLSLELKAKQGSWVTLLGETEEQGIRMAERAGTIVYEVLTAISARVPRIYT